MQRGRIPLVAHTTVRMMSPPIEDGNGSNPGPGNNGNPVDPGNPPPGEPLPTCPWWDPSCALSDGYNSPGCRPETRAGRLNFDGGAYDNIKPHASWTTVVIDAMWWLRLVAWAAIFAALWVAVLAPAYAHPFPIPSTKHRLPTKYIMYSGRPARKRQSRAMRSKPQRQPRMQRRRQPGRHHHRQQVSARGRPCAAARRAKAALFPALNNSNSTHRGLTGVGWRSTYEVVLVDLGSALQIIDADGRRLTFSRHSQTSQACASARDPRTAE